MIHKNIIKYNLWTNKCSETCSVFTIPIYYKCIAYNMCVVIIDLLLQYVSKIPI